MIYKYHILCMLSTMDYGEFEQQLNELGKQGWKVCGVMENNCVILMKEFRSWEQV